MKRILKAIFLSGLNLLLGWINSAKGFVGTLFGWVKNLFRGWASRKVATEGNPPRRRRAYFRLYYWLVSMQPTFDSLSFIDRLKAVFFSVLRWLGRKMTPMGGALGRVKIAFKGWKNRKITPERVTIKSDPIENQTARFNTYTGRTRKPDFDFPMLDIPIGSKLSFKADKTIIATVVSEDEIECEGRREAVSPMAMFFLERHFGRPKWDSGSRHWLYEGETLEKRRHRREREGKIS